MEPTEAVKLQMDDQDLERPWAARQWWIFYIDIFKHDLQESYESLDDSQNFEMFSTQYHNLSSSIVNKHSPLLKKKCVTSHPPWMDHEFKQSRALRRKCERIWKKDRSDLNRDNYIQQKKRCADLALEKQKYHYTKLIQNAGNCQKSLFKIANEMLDKTKSKVLPQYSDPKHLANEFNEYFVEKVQKIRNSIPRTDGDST